ncbi:MAG: restriction endonuclease subunit S [Methanomethylovorans sp.]|uniref:restriction endonuclease subunit S n=1 Tax=Methanomethylovorans sp. TaxID=2758717 RepID=UPI003C758239
MSAEAVAESIPPGYKQTEVGVIPEDWDIVKALDACSKIQDGTHFSPQIGGNDYLYITSKNIRFGYLDTSTAVRIDKFQHYVIYRRCDVKKGDLLLTKDGASTGNAAINTLDEEFSLLSSVAFLRFQQNQHCAAYFLQQILTSQGQRQIQDAMAGNAITRLTLEKIKKLRFPVPPTLAEQEAIATALSDTDALIESLEQLIAKKRQIKQGAMQELLTGKRRLPGFSGEWEVKPLAEVATFHKGRGLSKSELDTFGPYPCIHYGELFTQYSETIQDIISHTNNAEGCFFSIANDVLMPTSDVTPNGLAKASCIGISGVILGGDILVIRAATDSVLGSFLSYVIRHAQNQILQLVTGTTVFHLYASDMKKFTLLIPTIDEQQAIVVVLDAIDSEITVLEEKLAKTRQIKQGMMQELLTGRIRLV